MTFGSTAGTAAEGNDPRLSDTRDPKAHKSTHAIGGPDALSPADIGAQPVDSDLTTIAGLTATTSNVIQSVGSAWASRTPAQLKATLALAKGDVGLGNVDNTSDANKPVSTAQQTAFDLKLNISDADERARDALGAALEAGANVTIAPNDATDKIVISATAGAYTVNTFQPYAVETFSPTAGTPKTFTLAQTNYGVQLVFLNGQQLQTSEYTLPTSTTVEVTPAEGAFVSGDKVVIVYSKAAVFAGSFSEDIAVTDATKGVVLKDRVSGVNYRLFMSGGVLGTETA
ncbi:MAG: hypothetical protein WC054_01100 [Candidatus Nanopelagicales bacterium]